MKKLTTLFLTTAVAAALFTSSLSAQSIDDAKKSLYYGRTTSAKQTLDKLIASNSKNAEAIYWLGQTYLRMDDVAGAKKVYQDALNNGVNDPLIWVGMGHVALLQGNKADARQRFEAAITNSMNKKKENPNILNAIGRANADGPATAGDPSYAIDKLKRAAELDPNNADIYVNMGVNYLKLGPDQGGNAFEAFNNALRIDPNNAQAKLRLGRIFESQGNTEQFLQYYNSAIQGDASYAPAYLELYEYYALRDVNKAKEYLEKYVANSDKDCNTEFFYADYLFRAGKYQESLQKARDMENGACKNYPRLKVLYAYDYDRMGDSMQARSNIESFLSTASPNQIRPADYDIAGRILLKFPGQETVASSYIEKAMQADTIPANKTRYITTMIDAMTKTGNSAELLRWYGRLQEAKGQLNNREMYLYAAAATKAGQFTLADTVSRTYIQKYPDQEYGYVLLANNAKSADSTTGASFPAVREYIDFMKRTDSVKYKDRIKAQYNYIATVASDKMRDYQTALDAENAILAMDPSDAYAQQAADALKKALSGGGKSQPARKTPSKKGK